MINQDRSKREEVFDSFRSSLEDCVSVVTALANVSDKPSEMVEMMQLALTNDAQLKLLLSLVTRQNKR